MHAKKLRSQGQKKARYNNNTNVRSIAVRPGTTTRPPDNSGTVQIPRPITTRSQIAKRTFKQEYMLATGVSTPVFLSASLYYPFYQLLSPASNYAQSLPTPLNDMLAAYGLYKVKQVQAIIEPLITSTTIPAPLTIGMVLDVLSPITSTLTQTQLLDYQNATKVSPNFPSEVRYTVPKLAANSTNQLVLSGGWLDTNSAMAQPNTYGFLCVTQASPNTASTPYANLTLVYEIWFKNPT